MPGDNWIDETIEYAKELDMSVSWLGAYEYMHGTSLLESNLDNVFEGPAAALVLQAYPEIDQQLTKVYKSLYGLYRKLGVAWAELEDKEKEVPKIMIDIE